MNSNEQGNNSIIASPQMTGSSTDNDLIIKLEKLLNAANEDSRFLVCKVFESLVNPNDVDDKSTILLSQQNFLFQRIPLFIQILKPPVPNNLIGHIGFLVKNILFKEDYKRLFHYPKLPAYFITNPHTKPRMYLRILHNNRDPFLIIPNANEKKPEYFHIGHFCKLPKLPKDKPITEKLVNQDGEVIVNDNLLQPFALSEKDKYFLLTEPSASQITPYSVIISELEQETTANLFQWFIIQSVTLSDGCKIMIQHAGTPYKCQMTKEQFVESQFHVCPLCQLSYTTPELSFLMDDAMPSGSSNLYHSSITTHQQQMNLMNQSAMAHHISMTQTRSPMISPQTPYGTPTQQSPYTMKANEIRSSTPQISQSPPIPIVSYQQYQMQKSNDTNPVQDETEIDQQTANEQWNDDDFDLMDDNFDF